MILLSHWVTSDGLNGPTYRAILMPAPSQSYQFLVSITSSSMYFTTSDISFGVSFLSIDLPCLCHILHHFSLIVPCHFQLYILSYSLLFCICIVGIILVINFRCGFTIDGVTIFISCHVYFVIFPI